MVKHINRMITNHTRFFAAINDKKMVGVRFCSKADHGVLDRICAPIGYGQGSESHDELNRYWLWDYAGTSGSHTLGLLPHQIVDLQVLGEVFDPAQFTIGPSPASVSQTGGLPPTTVVSSGGVHKSEVMNALVEATGDEMHRPTNQAVVSGFRL